MRLLFVALFALIRPWLVVSDLHVDPFERGPEVPYKSDTPWSLFDSTVAAMRSADPQAPVVVITGDFLTHDWSSKARAAGVDPQKAALSTLGRIARSFDRAFPHAQFLIALGNNDDPCGDYRLSPDSPYLRRFAQIWAPLVNRHGAAPEFERNFSLGGFYDSRTPGFRAIVLDDIVWSVVYRGCGGPDASWAQFAWLTSLADRDDKERTVFMMHIPPGIDPSATLLAQRFVVVPFWMPGVRSRFEHLEQRFSVPFAIAGHLHLLDFRIENSVPVVVAPSISSIYGNNPSFLTLQIQNGRIADYTAFVYDRLYERWSAAASFDRLFGAKGFSIDDLGALHARIGADAATRKHWLWLAMGATDGASELSENWTAFWCAQTHLGRDYIGCAGDQRRVAVLPVAAGAVVVVAVLATLWYFRRRSKRKTKAA